MVSPPTYGVPIDWVIGLIAGGDQWPIRKSGRKMQRMEETKLGKDIQE